jgi:hypothetical protein
MTETPTPAVDQIWQDNDPRSPGRYLKLIAVDDTHATAVPVEWDDLFGVAHPMGGARATRIRLDRFRPTSTGYRYVGTAK